MRENWNHAKFSGNYIKKQTHTDRKLTEVRDPKGISPKYQVFQIAHKGVNLKPTKKTISLLKYIKISVEIKSQFYLQFNKCVH